jgi:hypothetical protein
MKDDDVLVCFSLADIFFFFVGLNFSWYNETYYDEMFFHDKIRNVGLLAGSHPAPGGFHLLLP